MAHITPNPSDDQAGGGSLLGDVLVTGGSGFLGYHLVGQLLADPECGAVHVLDRVAAGSSSSANHHAGATYHACSVEDAAGVRALLSSARPRVVFHCSSPNFSFPDEAGRARGRGAAADQLESNVDGTRVLLDEVRRCGSVAALVLAATIDMYRNPPHVDGDESLPTWADVDDGPGPPEEAYARSKAAAHKLVLAANEPDSLSSSASGRPPLKTASLVLAHAYGERDSQMVRTMLGTAARPGVPFVQIGAGGNAIEVVDVANAAAALRLAAKALLDRSRASGRVDGEAFNVSDGRPVPFWHHVRVMYDAAQRHYGTKGEPRVVVVPGWVMRAVVWIVYWTLAIFTLGRVRPPVSLSRQALVYSLHSHTYSTRKIRERLGFEPVSDHDAVVAAAVEWELKRREAETGTAKKVA
ncbi:hypothetical protein RB598_007319 [Gaeumannomyces tritici]